MAEAVVAAATRVTAMRDVKRILYMVFGVWEGGNGMCDAVLL